MHDNYCQTQRNAFQNIYDKFAYNFPFLPTIPLLVFFPPFSFLKIGVHWLQDIVTIHPPQPPEQILYSPRQSGLFQINNIINLRVRDN